MISPTWIAVIAPALIGGGTLVHGELVRRQDRRDREAERVKEAGRIEAERAERERALKNSVESLAQEVAAKTIRRQEETVDRLNKRIDEYEAINETYRQQNRLLLERIERLSVQADESRARADRCEAESAKLQAQIGQLSCELELLRQAQTNGGGSNRGTASV